MPENQQKILLKMRFLSLPSRDSNSIFLVWGPEIYIFIRFPGDSGAAWTQFYLIVEGKEELEESVGSI